MGGRAAAGRGARAAERARGTVHGRADVSRRGDDGIEAGQDVATLSFVATLFVQDPRSIFPWLWMFHPHAEVLAGADGLRVRMKQDLEEVLRHYEG